jgi:hypothetical protein
MTEDFGGRSKLSFWENIISIPLLLGGILYMIVRTLLNALKDFSLKALRRG